MPLDDWLPISDFAERHSTWVAASPTSVFEAVATTDLADPWLVRALMGVRLVPAVLAEPRAAWQRMREPRGPVTLRRVMGYQFARLSEEPGRELVLGLEGRFWTPTGGLVPTGPERFRGPLTPGIARAVWNFCVDPEVREGRAGTRLVTETRVRCADAATRRSFGRYWRVIQPFSALIRRSMLRAIRREAERQGDHAPRARRGEANQPFLDPPRRQ